VTSHRADDSSVAEALAEWPGSASAKAIVLETNPTILERSYGPRQRMTNDCA
jgi:hypothetical protein